MLLFEASATGNKWSLKAFTSQLRDRFLLLVSSREQLRGERVFMQFLTQQQLNA